MMMKKPQRKDESEYKIDLVTMDGDGSFSCPKCGMTISPKTRLKKTTKS